MPISEWARKRNEALFSLDRAKIETFYHERGQDCPEEDIVFWAGTYKALLAITSTPQELRDKAVDWLTLNGFSTEIGLYK